MKLRYFILEKLPLIAAQFIMIALVFYLFWLVDLSSYIAILLSISLFSLTFLALTYEYIVKSRYYKRLYQTLDHLDKKHYIGTMLETPDFLDAEILEDILVQTTKSMNDDIASHKRIASEYQDYIETWIHEIKLPIACIQLLCENNPGDFSNNISDELKRVENHVEQALFYARTTNLENDYAIKKTTLEVLVNNSLKKHAKVLIAQRVKIDKQALDKQIYCDPKWLDFILGQLIANSMKYKKDQLTLTFSSSEQADSVSLNIADNGIGIPAADLPRVFQRGFTGTNGRQFAKSTGIGLYLCREMCNKMYLDLQISAALNQGTTVSIVFPKDSRFK